MVNGTLKLLLNTCNFSRQKRKPLMQFFNRQGIKILPHCEGQRVTGLARE